MTPDAGYSSSPKEPGLSALPGGPAIRVLHRAVSGRTRYRIPALYRSPPLKEHIEHTLRSRREVISFSASVLTGNLLVLYRTEVSEEEISAVIEEVVCTFERGSHVASAGSVGQSAAAGAYRKGGRLLQGAEQLLLPWHLMEPQQIADSFATSLERGLAGDLPQKYLRRYGPNLLPRGAPRSALQLLLGQLNSLPVLLLSASAALSLATGGIADAIAIVTVILINAAIGYLTEKEAQRAIQSLERLVQRVALVVRDGAQVEIPAHLVVPGDLLVLKRGSHVAADCRIIDSAELTIDESALTGESMPVVKSPQLLQRPETALGDRFNLAFLGTLVTGGQGTALVVATGRFTEIGKVQAMVGEAEAPKTPMARELDRLGRRLVGIYGGVCALVFCAALLRGFRLLQVLRSTISLAVAAIPEGLPTVATTILALGVSELKRHQVLIRHLGAAETLGSVQTVCLDKTGTLTLNRMSVVALHVGLRDCTVHGSTVRVGDAEIAPDAFAELARLVEVCALCNETQAAEAGQLQGSATETALIRLASGSGLNIEALRERYPLVQVTHRSESRNYMLTWHEIAADSPFPRADEGGLLVAVKGSPLEVLSLCRRRLAGDAVLPLSDADRLAVELANERMAGSSLRVLGAAYARGDDAGEPEDLVWLGLVGMADPLRPGVKELIQLFHRAGIETLMITGDQVATAYAIGNELGLGNGAALRIFDSEHLQEVDPELLSAFAQGVHAFARVSPAQKLQIVRALQRGGRIVAMTGDGINDGPALKAADVGVALGSAGTDVAREVADVVLEGDDLEGIVRAVRHGRTIRDNIGKSLRFLLATNLSEVLVMLGAITLGLGQPLNPMQLLWINLISDIFPGLALALEPPEPDVLQRPPADPQAGIISDRDFPSLALQGGALTAGALAAYGYGIVRYGRGGRAGTLAFTSLAAAQLLHALSCRSQRSSLLGGAPLAPNRYLTWALAGSFLLQGGTLVVPGLRRLLQVEAFGALDAIVVGGSAVLPLFFNEAVKREEP